VNASGTWKDRWRDSIVGFAVIVIRPTASRRPGSLEVAEFFSVHIAAHTERRLPGAMRRKPDERRRHLEGKSAELSLPACPLRFRFSNRISHVSPARSHWLTAAFGTVHFGLMLNL
jgi:hypothetical protein